MDQLPNPNLESFVEKEARWRSLAKSSLGIPGKLWYGGYAGLTMSWNGAGELKDWVFNINKLRIDSFAKERFPKCYEQLDGPSKRLMRSFLEPGPFANTFSLLGLGGVSAPDSDALGALKSFPELSRDMFGPDALDDTSYVMEQEKAREGRERWFYINGIATSRSLAALNATALKRLLNRDFITIHNPTQGPAHDLVECALQKFTNVNTEVVARAFIQVADAILDDEVEKVVLVAHSQGTIISGDVLDLLYCGVDSKYFDRTNMNGEDLKNFMSMSHGTVKSHEVEERLRKLQGQADKIKKKLELYMFANAASRMCYLDDELPLPHIESFANAHDIVTRLGSLARDEFHAEDVVRIHGPLLFQRRYGHLLNAHYLSGLQTSKSAQYKLLGPIDDQFCVGSSVHDAVHGNPAEKNPKWRTTDEPSRFIHKYLGQQPLKADAHA